MGFEREEFNQFVFENDVIKFHPGGVELNSGRVSKWYVNYRRVTNRVSSLDELTDYILSYVKSEGLEPDCFYGVPEGATKIALITQYKYSKMKKGSDLLPMGRGKVKDHGEGRGEYFIGEPEGEVVIIEDVTTTGGSLINSIEDLLRTGCEVTATLCLTDRNELRSDERTVKRAVMEEYDIEHYSMSNLMELIPRLLDEEFKDWDDDVVRLYMKDE